MNAEWLIIYEQFRKKLSSDFLAIGPFQHAAKLRTSGGWYDAPKGGRLYSEDEYRAIMAAKNGLSDPDAIKLSEYDLAQIAA